MPSKKLNTAVIGTGNMGSYHVRNYSEIPGSNLVAISDIDEKAKEIADAYNCRFYTDYREMLKKEKLDAVSICAPTKWHKSIALDVIKRKINLLVEKPISDNLKDAKEMIREAKKNNVVLTIGHIERFNPAVQKLKEIIKKGELGEITSIIIRRVGFYPLRQPTTNVIIDLAIHDIDIVNFLTEELPKKMTASVQKICGKHEDSAEIFLKYKKFTAFIQTNWITPVKIRTITINSTKGYIETNYITQAMVLYENQKIDYSNIETFKKFVAFSKNPRKKIIPINKKEPLKEELINFLGAINRKNKLMVTGQNAYDALKIALKAYQNKY